MERVKRLISQKAHFPMICNTQLSEGYHSGIYFNFHHSNHEVNSINTEFTLQINPKGMCQLHKYS